MDWRQSKRPAAIPKAVRELEVNDEVLFRYDAGLAPPGKLWERITYYISREKARARKQLITKMFARTHVENEGILVTRTR